MDYEMERIEKKLEFVSSQNMVITLQNDIMLRILDGKGDDKKTEKVREILEDAILISAEMSSLLVDMEQEPMKHKGGGAKNVKNKVQVVRTG